MLGGGGDCHVRCCTDPTVARAGESGELHGACLDSLALGSEQHSLRPALLGSDQHSRSHRLATVFRPRSPSCAPASHLAHAHARAGSRDRALGLARSPLTAASVAQLHVRGCTRAKRSGPQAASPRSCSTLPHLEAARASTDEEWPAARSARQTAVRRSSSRARCCCARHGCGRGGSSWAARGCSSGARRSAADCASVYASMRAIYGGVRAINGGVCAISASPRAPPCPSPAPPSDPRGRAHARVPGLLLHHERRLRAP
eukprot:243724-Rhodomonas_salina.1